MNLSFYIIKYTTMSSIFASPVFQSVLLIGLTSLGIANNSVKWVGSKILFQCDNYVLNTYLYFILSWGIIMATIASLHSQDISLSSMFTGFSGIALFFLSIVLIYSLVLMPPEYFVTKHVLFVLQMAMLGTMIYPLYVKNAGLFFHAGLTALLLFILLSVISIYAPSMLSGSMQTYLLTALVTLLMARIVEYFIALFRPETYQKYSHLSKIVSYVAIALFSLFVVYDTQSTLQHAKHCVRPDYINESLGLVLDSVNLMTNLFDTMDS